MPVIIASLQTSRYNIRSLAFSVKAEEYCPLFTVEIERRYDRRGRGWGMGVSSVVIKDNILHLGLCGILLFVREWCFPISVFLQSKLRQLRSEICKLFKDGLCEQVIAISIIMHMCRISRFS